MNNKKLNELRDMFHQNAKDKGFHDPGKNESQAALQFHIVAELAEGWVDLRNGHSVQDKWYTDNGWYIVELKEPKESDFPCIVWSDGAGYGDFCPDLEGFSRIGHYTHWKPFKAPNGSRKPCGFQTELTDTAIRLYDMAGKNLLGLTTWDFDTGFDRGNNSYFNDTASFLMVIAESLADIKNHMYCSHIIGMIYGFAEANGIDLGAAIQEKHEYNTGRERLHGKAF